MIEQSTKTKMHKINEYSQLREVLIVTVIAEIYYMYLWEFLFRFVSQLTRHSWSSWLIDSYAGCENSPKLFEDPRFAETYQYSIKYAWRACYTASNHIGYKLCRDTSHHSWNTRRVIRISLVSERKETNASEGAMKGVSGLGLWSFPISFRFFHRPPLTCGHAGRRETFAQILGINFAIT